MRTDFLTSEAVDRSRACQLQYKIIRGVVNSLLITNTTTWHQKDLLTVKLRHAGGVMNIVDRVSCLTLALLCDLKQGMPTTGTPNYVGDAGGQGENNAENGFVRINAGVQVVVNAFTIPLGQITLSGREELEVTIDTAIQTKEAGVTGPLPVGKMRLSSVSAKSRVDTILCYDISADLESQQGEVREIYALGKKGISLFNVLPGSSNAAPVGKDVIIKLQADGTDSENDIETYGALTAITGALTAQPNALVRVFQDFDSLPAQVYVKVFGDDKNDVELLYVRENAVPHMVSASISANIEKEVKRVEVLEQNEPEKAKALIQAGVIAPSIKLAEAKDNFVAAVPPPTK